MQMLKKEINLLKMYDIWQQSPVFFFHLPKVIFFVFFLMFPFCYMKVKVTLKLFWKENISI